VTPAAAAAALWRHNSEQTEADFLEQLLEPAGASKQQPQGTGSAILPPRGSLVGKPVALLVEVSVVL
jgi:hypothetical protein